MLYSSNIALNQGKHRNGSREVYFLDSKFDDGEPSTGYLIPESSIIVNRWGDACGFGDGSWNFNNQTGCKLIVNGKLIFN